MKTKQTSIFQRPIKKIHSAENQLNLLFFHLTAH